MLCASKLTELQQRGEKAPVFHRFSPFFDCFGLFSVVFCCVSRVSSGELEAEEQLEALRGEAQELREELARRVEPGAAEIE